MSVLQDILTWSEDPKRSLWQRIALRLLLVQPSLSDQDMEELVHVALAEHGHDGMEVAPDVLADEDLPHSDRVTGVRPLFLNLLPTASA